MNELIKIDRQEIGSDQIQTVNARDLHAFLEVKKDFPTWIKAQIKRARFKEGRDYVKHHQKVALSKTGQTSIEYHLTIESAKHLSMMSGTDKGEQVRDYFLECELVAQRQAITSKYYIPQTLSEALRFSADLADQNQTLQLQIEADRPKVELASAIIASSKSVGITEYCKSISKLEGFIIGRNNFYAWLRAEKMLNHKNLPYHEYLDKGYFEVQEGVYESVGNGPVPFFKTVITGHGQERLLARIRQSPTFANYLNNYSKAGVIRSAMMAAVQ